MNKIPAKQIYLLMVIIGGIMTLSVYSTFSIFTLESETSDIVSIQTSNVLNLSSNTYEYKQVTVPKDSYINTDMDIYNNYDYDLCYTVWYKVASSTVNQSKIRIYENTDDSLSTSGSIGSVKGKRISLTITNVSDDDIKVNLGVAYSKNDGTCELNLSKDKSLVSLTVNNIKLLSDTLIKDLKVETSISNYLTYKSVTEEINIPKEDNIYVSSSYTYIDEVFTLTNPELVGYDDIDNNLNNNYTCLDKNECHHLYQILDINKNTDSYVIKEYNLLSGYMSGESGLRKVNTNNYYYYGDNPHNFINYNCENNKCELWRIVGVFYDNNSHEYITKIIRNNSLGLYEYDNENNSWNTSNISKYLNNEYKLLDNAGIKTNKFSIENILNNKINYLEEKNEQKLILMNLSDYLNTSICKDKNIDEYNTTCLTNNWLNMNLDTPEWTMSISYEEPYQDEETEELITPTNDMVYAVSNSITKENITSKLNIRPIVYLDSKTILIDGDGTIDNPYMVR